MKVVFILAILVAAATAVPRPIVPNPLTGIAPTIVGGKVADAHEFPFIVWLHLNKEAGCGGSIINENWVVTAGHCTNYLSGDTDFVNVHAGDHVVLTDEGTEQIVRVDALASDGTTRLIITHETFGPVTLKDDIGLIHSDTIPFNITLSIYISAIDLPPFDLAPADYIKEGSIMIVAGWGVVNDSSGSLANTLRKTNTTVISQDDCKDVYGNIVGDGKFCTQYTGGDEGFHGSCSGDSGGPVFLYDVQTVLRGIVSFGSSAGCQSGDPDGFARCAFYRQWIYDTTNGEV